MRFAELYLERYGHFEACRLPFQAGTPDFHMIYGANEAGKSTALAAISDLLFGFPLRSPYNFRFDYPLLRVGAVLEEDGQRLACRRRKTRDHSLIDASEQPLDEGMLSALLHGLNRESFGAGFSLDQAGLRRGGEAMVQASDDLGQALFAAGSGLTGIASVKAALEREVDGIWGKHTSNRRTFTAAAKQLDASQQIIRKAQLKPKEWSDAQAAVEACGQTLRELQQKQAAVTAERTAAERLRRISAAMRSRSAVLAAIAGQGPVTVFSPAEDKAAEAALAALAQATEAHDAAARHRDGVVGRLNPLQADPITELGERIEDLIETRGAVTKALADLARLEIERQGMEERATVLRTELALHGDLPSSLEIRKLRDIATRHAGLITGLRARDGELEDLRIRAQALRGELADAMLAEGLDGLRAAITLARGLGDDFDERCTEAQTSMQRAESDAQAALAALLPWQGNPDGLAVLCEIDDSEIQAASDAERTLTAILDTERAESRRLENEIALLDTQRTSLAQTGQAVSADEVRQAREARDGLWQVIDTHLRHGGPPSSSAGLGDRFASALQTADAVADRRYETAEASARLTGLDQNRMIQDLRRQQIEQSVQEAEKNIETKRSAWDARLQALALPPLSPLPLRSWYAQRRTALDLHRGAVEARQQAARITERRAETVQVLAKTLKIPPETDRLSLMLAAADRERLAGETLELAFREKSTRLAGLEDEIARQERLAAQDRRALQATVVEWTEASARLNITADVAVIDGWLELVEELRCTLDGITTHSRRIKGIVADRTAFDEAVMALAADARMEAQTDPGQILGLLRDRLSKARSVAQEINTLKAERKKHQADMDRAATERNIALDRLRPFLAHAGVEEATCLFPLLERSRIHQERLGQLADAEQRIVTDGDHLPLADLVATWETCDPDAVASQAVTLGQTLDALNAEVAAAANALGEARKAFETLDQSSRAAVDAAADAEAAKADMKAEAEVYVLKRVQWFLLRRAVDRYREHRQAPLLTRAGALFDNLTLGRFVDLHIDYEAPTPRLLGVRADRQTFVPIDGMSEGTTDQLFLALRLAAVEQSNAAGVRIPFIADDLFVNFDDDRAKAGLNVLSELAASTQILFFTHHVHLRNMGQTVAALACLEL